MYNVRNVCGKDLAIQLEKGGVILRPNKCTDLDQRCSRKWINSNFDIRKLITKGFLQVTHDSRAALPKAPVRPIIRAQQSVATVPSRVVSNKPVEIIDLVSFPDVEINDTGRVTVAQPEVVSEKIVERAEPITVPDFPVPEALVAEPVPVVEPLIEVSPVFEAAPVEVASEPVLEVVPAPVAEVVPVVEVAPEILESEKKSEEASVYGGFSEFNRSSSRKKKSRR